MKASYEKITVEKGESWAFFRRDAQLSLPFNWHYHPEYELSLVLNARGTRYIGDHIEHFTGCDLVLTGPNLPHTWAVTSADPVELIDVRVIWFTRQWLENLCEVCPEFIPVLQWLAGARHGLLFSQTILLEVRPLMEQMIEAESIERLLLMFKVMRTLSQAQPMLLSAAAFTGELNTRGEGRIKRVTQYLTEHYCENINLEVLAQLANLSVNSLCRAFKQHTRMTISEYVTQLRIGSVCEELIEKNEAISLIAYRAGYCNLTHFNRQFKRIKSMSPSEFRAKFRRESH
ncbi:helix-turn-helix domain-containing protein [Deefgea rivuli]|uniref:helix-turn-helix domain-containing protein n=1 Tax=Deefgea rivuli TaxID=400948 RepID=UPI000482A442|nr:AraC family transcriptional regulator [Deefgea rivuli]